MGLLVFAAAGRLSIQESSVCSVGTGPVFTLNKGALGFRAHLQITTKPSSPAFTFCLVNAHFTAHTEKLLRRRRDFYEISRRMLFSVPSGSLGLWQHDVVVWAGDLNYRLEGAGSRKDIQQIVEKNPAAEVFGALAAFDQLSREMSALTVLPGFVEAPIAFAPTFKYDVGPGAGFDTSRKGRAPAWCDRILWTHGARYAAADDSAKKVPRVSVTLYNSVPEAFISDHKPVHATIHVDTGELVSLERRLDISPTPAWLRPDPSYLLKQRLGYAAGALVRGVGKALLDRPAFLALLVAVILYYFLNK